MTNLGKQKGILNAETEAKGDKIIRNRIQEEQ